MVAMVSLPGAPPFVEGLFNYHGEILPVLNMRFRFRAEPVPIRASQMLVVARREGRNCAFRVDHIEGLRDVDPASVHDTGRLSPAVDAITGVVALEDGLLLIYGLETFLSETEEEEMKSFLASVPGDAV
jgi:purine-binding chemotaxis protein CheW